MIVQWKKSLITNDFRVFQDTYSEKDERDKLIESLYKEIGSLTMYIVNPLSMNERKFMIERLTKPLSHRLQCDLLSVRRSSLYYTPSMENEENLNVIRIMDAQYLKQYHDRRMRYECLGRSYGTTRKS